MYRYGKRLTEHPVLCFARRLSGTTGRPSMTFEGNAKEFKGTDEERMKKVFGGRLAGESPQPRGRGLAGDGRHIAGVYIPSKPSEPENCCMSGCVNCVWVVYNEDLKEWREKRRKAAKLIKGTNEVWPADFSPPLRLLDTANVPNSLKAKKQTLGKQKKRMNAASLFAQQATSTSDEGKIETSGSQEAQDISPEEQVATSDDDGWQNVPIYIKAFTEFEDKKRKEHDVTVSRDEVRAM